jgi:hypothetical protein
MNIFLLSNSSNFMAILPMLRWTSLHIHANPFLISSEGRLRSPKIFEATEINAESGQAENQLRVEQSTREGNFRHLILNAEPNKKAYNFDFFLFFDLQILIKVIY